MQRKLHFLLIFGIFSIVSILAIEAKAKDTLSYFNVDSSIKVYRSRTLVKSCQRFYVNAKFELTDLKIGLISNKANTEANLNIYLDEGQQSVPRTENKQSQTIKLVKSKTGYEELSISLSSSLQVNYQNLFICVEDLSDGLYLVMDDVFNPLNCQSNIDAFSTQVMKNKDGTWEFGNYNFDITLIGNIQHDANEDEKYFSLNVEKYFNKKDLDSINSRKNINLSIVDFNNDKKQDLIINNQAYYYNSDSSKYFRYNELNKYLNDSNLCNYYTDVDNDDKLDLVSLRYYFQDSVKQGIELEILNDFRNSKKLKSKTSKFIGIKSISSVNIFDLDDDNYPEIILTQSSSDDTSQHNNNLVLKNKNGKFTVSFLYDETQISKNGIFSFVDVDENKQSRQLQLFLDNGNLSTWNMQNEYFKNRANKKIKQTSTVDSLNNIAQVYDVDFLNCNDIEGINKNLLITANSYGRLLAKTDAGQVFLDKADSSMNSLFLNANKNWCVKNSGVLVEDFDNNGYADFIQFVDGICYSASLFMHKNGNIEKITSKSGFNKISLGNDGVALDFNQDGNQDFLSFSDRQLVMYKNIIKSNNNHTVIYDQMNKYFQNGKTVALYSGDKIITKIINNNYTWNIQSAAVYNFGMGDKDKVDSVEVYKDGKRIIMTDVKLNQINDIKDLDIRSEEFKVKVYAYPNPFKTDLQMEVSGNRIHEMNISIIDFNGNLVKSLYKQVPNSSKTTITWDGTNNNNQQVTDGTYYIVANQFSSTTVLKIIKKV
jgi:hypothetical protein